VTAPAFEPRRRPRAPYDHTTREWNVRAGGVCVRAACAVVLLLIRAGCLAGLAVPLGPARLTVERAGEGGRAGGLKPYRRRWPGVDERYISRRRAGARLGHLCTCCPQVGESASCCGLGCGATLLVLRLEGGLEAVEQRGALTHRGAAVYCETTEFVLCVCNLRWRPVSVQGRAGGPGAGPVTPW